MKHFNHSLFFTFCLLTAHTGHTAANYPYACEQPWQKVDEAGKALRKCFLNHEDKIEDPNFYLTCETEYKTNAESFRQLKKCQRDSNPFTKK